MALGTDYAMQDCSIARALEIVGERWTLLIVRDAIFGVRRFTDFQNHLDISKAVLSIRLAALIENGVLVKDGDDYLPTADAVGLWPALSALARWNDARTDDGPRRIFSHADCGTDLVAGRCDTCDTAPEAGELDVRPGPGSKPALRSDPVARALRDRHRLMTPLRTAH